MNAALVSIRDFLKTFKNLTNLKLLMSKEKQQNIWSKMKNFDYI